MAERLSRTDINALLGRHGLEPSRALGQNFLCDGSMIDKIVRLAGVVPGDRVVEIGPGLGSLTLGLCDAGASVLAVEIDRYLIDPLTEVVADRDVTIVNADAQTLDWDARLGHDAWKVVANLPYNVATPLVLDLLSTQPQLQSFLVMVQREVGERLAAGPGTKTSGIPSVIVSYWGTARVVGSVPAQLFLPVPKVESVLVRIDRAATPNSDAPFERLSTLVRAGFNQRRKMIRRSLSAFLDEEQIAGVDVDPTLRAEALDLDAWSRLASIGAAPDG